MNRIERGQKPCSTSRGPGIAHFWREIALAGPAGAQMIFGLIFSADSKSYAYSISRTLSDLYVVVG
jgi:hypothetical protein